MKTVSKDNKLSFPTIANMMLYFVYYYTETDISHNDILLLSKSLYWIKIPAISY